MKNCKINRFLIIFSFILLLGVSFSLTITTIHIDSLEDSLERTLFKLDSNIAMNKSRIILNEIDNIINKKENSIIKYTLRKPSYEYLRSITVQIEGTGQVEKNGEKNRVAWGGTGVVVKVDKDYTYILTNAHVSGRNRDPVMLYITDNDKRVEAKIIKRHEYLDLALIRVKGELEEKRAVKGFSYAKPQDKIFLVGHHLGRPYVYGEGVFAGYQGIFGIVQIPTMFGNSGSGVVNQDGELVSLVFAINAVGLGYDSSHGLVVDGFSVQYFLEDLGIIK